MTDLSMTKVYKVVPL